MIALLLLALSQLDNPRVALARVELTGPCTALSASVEGAGSFELELAQPLSAGERRTFEVAVPLPPAPLTAELRSRLISNALETVGRARLIGLEPPADRSSISPELLARPRVVLAAASTRLPWSALFVLGAALAISLAQRRRVALLTAVALLGSVAVLVIVGKLGAPAIPAARLLEALFDAEPGEPFLAVEARLGSLRAANLDGAQLELSPASRPIHCRTEQDPPSFSFESPGATFLRRQAFDPGARRLTRAVNAFGSFDEAWLREGDGSWKSLGAWALGEPLPDGGGGREDLPPGWLVPALPMGTSIFLGRLAPGHVQAFEDDSRSVERPPTPTWVRGLGL